MGPVWPTLCMILLDIAASFSSGVFSIRRCQDSIVRFLAESWISGYSSWARTRLASWHALVDRITPDQVMTSVGLYDCMSAAKRRFVETTFALSNPPSVISFLPDFLFSVVRRVLPQHQHITFRVCTTMTAIGYTSYPEKADSDWPLNGLIFWPLHHCVFWSLYWLQ